MKIEAENDVPNDVILDYPEEKPKSDQALWKKVLRFLFSFVGLFLLLAGYTLLGAIYFYNLEKPLENIKYQKMMARTADLKASLEVTL